MTDNTLNLPNHDIYLLRHGETEWNESGRIQGRHNSDLTSRGLAQALEQSTVVEHLLPGLGDHRRIVSPLSRARTTAIIAFGGRSFETDDRLLEIDCGDWEGLTPEERQRRDPLIVARCQNDFDLYRHAPGGEGINAVRERLVDFLNGIDSTTLVVAHKVVLVVMRALLCGQDEPYHSDMAPAQGTVLHIRDGVVIPLSNRKLPANLVCGSAAGTPQTGTS